MKLTDKELLNLIWLNQLKLLSRNVVCLYVNGRYGLYSNNHDYFKYCNSFNRIQRTNITSEIGSGQLLKRIKKLVAEGKLKETLKDCTYMIHSKKALEAFWFARKYWLDEGVPEGMGTHEDGRSFYKTKKLLNIDFHYQALEILLIRKFANNNASGVAA